MSVGRRGELILRERDGEYEIISNGVFLMDTRDGRSERLLVRAGLEVLLPERGPVTRAADSEGLRLLMGGLGLGFSLAEALACPRVREVVVVEWEPAVVAWNRTTTGARTGGRVDDARVHCETADLVAWLQCRSREHRRSRDHRQGPDRGRFDLVCLDVDNGPHWTVDPGNAWLYGDLGVTALRERLVDGGVLTVWSAAHVPDFEARLERVFHRVDVLEVPVARGGPDLVYRARA